MMKSGVVLGMAAASCLAAGAARAQISDDVVKIGVLSDMSSLYSDIAGPGSVIAAKMAVADFGGKVAGKPIEIISAESVWESPYPTPGPVAGAGYGAG